MTEQELFEQVKKLLQENMISGSVQNERFSYHYTKPSPGRYPYQYFWDTCFHIFIFCALGDVAMAKKHLRSLFALQQENGFVGHMIYWDRLQPGRITDLFQLKPSLGLGYFKPHMSALIQPPLVAQALEQIYSESKDQAFLLELLPKLKKYFNWLARTRDLDGSGLITIITPFESGMDWKASYDPALGLPERKADWRLFLKVVYTDFRNFLHGYNLDKIYRQGYFLVKDAGFNTIYAQNLAALARLCQTVGDPDAAVYEERSRKLVQSMLEILYDEQSAAFLDVYGKDNIKSKVLTPTIFYPLVLEGVPDTIANKVIERHLYNEQEFNLPYPLPSVAANHPSFYPKESLYIWRGPSWVVHNWFLHQFLLERGLAKEARKLLDSIRSLIEKSGFREYYNPYTGEGYGARDFTWSGLVIDMLNMDKAYNKSA